MDLIDRAALINDMGLENAVKWGNKDGYQQAISYSTLMRYQIKYAIDDQPTVPAVPLEPLCEWLEKVAGKPCHESCAGCEDDVSGNGYKECWERMIREEVCNAL